MKKKHWFILIILIAYISFIFYKYNERTTMAMQEEKDNFTVVTSFYPMYIHTSAIMKGTPRQVINMADQTVGCLHDYQLTVEDTKKLYMADVLVINGLGSETFIEKAYSQNPNLKVINASEKIEANLEAYLHEEAYEDEHEHSHEEEAGHTHEEDEETHVHEDEHNDAHTHEDEHVHMNEHIWLSIEGSKAQIMEIATKLSELDPTYAPTYEANAKKYIEALEALSNEEMSVFKGIKDKKAVSVHDAFDYFAKEWDIDIVATIPEGSYENASARQIEELIQEMKKHQVEVIFTEAKNQDLAILKTIQSELPCKIYTLDALVNESDNSIGDGFEYVERMKENLRKIREAYSNE